MFGCVQWLGAFSVWKYSTRIVNYWTIYIQVGNFYVIKISVRPCPKRQQIAMKSHIFRDMTGWNKVSWRGIEKRDFSLSLIRNRRWELSLKSDNTLNEHLLFNIIFLRIDHSSCAHYEIHRVSILRNITNCYRVHL